MKAKTQIAVEKEILTREILQDGITMIHLNNLRAAVMIRSLNDPLLPTRTVGLIQGIPTSALTVNQRDNVLTIDQDPLSVDGGEATVTLMVPRGTKIQIRNHGGSIDIADVEGELTIYETESAGRVLISDAVNLMLQIGGGRIVTINRVSGDVFLRARGRRNVRINSGKINRLRASLSDGATFICAPSVTFREPAYFFGPNHPGECLTCD
jgi:hypothetical protein